MYITEDQNCVIVDPATWIEILVPWGLQTYLAAVQWVPYTFLGDKPYGNCTQDGVLRIPANHYRRIEKKLIYQLRSTNGVQELWANWTKTIQGLRSACLTVETRLDNKKDIPGELVGSLFRYMVFAKSFMAFNWLMELEPLAIEVSDNTHIPLDEVQQLLLSCSIPDCLPHYLEMELALLELAVGKITNTGAESVAREYGFCEGYPILPQKLENPDFIVDHCKNLRKEHGVADIRNSISTILDNENKKKGFRSLAKSSLLARSPNHYRPIVRALVDALRLAATEEEERHLWEMRAIRDFRLLIEHKGLDPATIIEEEVLNVYNANKIEPRGWYHKDRWPLIFASLPSYRAIQASSS